METQSALDCAVRFEKSMSRSLEYPVNLLRTEAFGHTLESYCRRLNGTNIFDPQYRSLACVNLYENFDLSRNLDTIQKLSGYLDEEDGAPLWRMVFIQSASSRGALGCSQEQLTYLLTYYQVMPSFLDFVLNFSIRGGPVAHASFRHENYLEMNSPELALPELKRSGIQIQHSFNLLSVERARNPDEKNQWPLRQVALYHSFDVTNGRSLWIILKGNQLMARRILAATKNHRHLKAAEINSPETSFIAGLQVQMMMIEWCSESWPEYIDHLEAEVAQTSVEGKAAPVEKMTSPSEIELMHSPKTTNTWGSQTGSSLASPKRRTFPRSSSDLLAIIRRMSGLESGVSTLPRDEPNEKDIEATAGLVEKEEDEGDKLSDLEKEFSFVKFQRLSLLGQDIEQALVVIEQNKGVLKAIEEHYHSVIESYGFTTHMKKDLCNSDITTFLTKLRSIERDLDIHYGRIQTLSRALENDKTVFTTLLQYKSEKVSEYFASSAKTSSDRMESMTQKMHSIAIRTEQETVSMHVITIFTLIFLPGTFIATLFSSGVFNWNDNGNLESDWVIRRSALKLFFSVSLPMMVIILSAWSMLYFYMRRKRQEEEGKWMLPVTEQQPPTGIRTNSGIFSEFVDKQSKQHVEEFSENNKSFIPLPILRDYWERAKIANILNAFNPPLPFCIDTIQDGYIRVFSILVHCGQVSNLEHFTKHNLHDNILPLKKRPDDWKGSFYDTLFSKFSRCQWTFCPLMFAPAHLEDCHLDPNQILPIVKLERITNERITQGDAAIIQKMTIHDSCHSLTPEGQPKQSTFVLKTYHNHRFQRIYENEIDALRTLKNQRSPNVITYYGSFRQDGTCNIILEYANGGDLAQFLKKTPSPKGDEVIQFWKSISLCFGGLHYIHHLVNTGGYHLNGIHEDIKPENILLFKGNSGSPYDFVPKIADFGLFTRVRRSKINSFDAMGRDRIGNQFYSSPESSHHASYHENAPNTINTRADIFSFGTVLSEASAWVKGGSSEITKYYEQRRALHRTKRAFRGNDYEGCFHDGVTRLPVVDEMHTTIRDHCKSTNDLITPRALDIIEKYMLLPNANSRSNARQLQERFQQIFDTPDHESLNSLLSISELESPSIKRQGLSLAELAEYLSKQQSTTSRDGRNGQTSTKREIDNLLKDLQVNVFDRHHLFFIDDSTSMKEHAESINEAFSALHYLARHLEGHKVELSVASGPRHPRCRRRSKKLLQLVERLKYQRDPDMMENRFRRLIDDVIIPRLPNHIFGINVNIRTRKPTSIYVFTDGNWRGDDTAACGVENHITRLREELQKRGLDRNYISFHFVRLGDNVNGKRYLGYLDRFGRADGQDNVDVKTMSSPVKSIIIGPLTQSNDEEDEEDFDF
ncbi:uncharacterized protein GGS22DRAFT_177782 [Annulohypoxylon maeteangense]|uniref:uncharacterized protein n=1 Tax=Annulohypoxylon maeteangense TaxID=1927788 RepID=UPI002008A228|nr:uncharacterized protein GGS22DRAFT_177782 [Annulohypoxylon maeteangense]KAI0889237.1 hypothetical protein GGS22DRAFT_177782 [Annulohypoxylon maeteangense]